MRSLPTESALAALAPSGQSGTEARWQTRVFQGRSSQAAATSHQKMRSIVRLERGGNYLSPVATIVRPTVSGRERVTWDVDVYPQERVSRAQYDWPTLTARSVRAC